jgi:hypothetical protein
LIAREKKEIAERKAFVSPLSCAQKGFSFLKGETFKRAEKVNPLKILPTAENSLRSNDFA